MAEKKKKTPKTPFEKIGAAYESEARRQEKSGNTEMALRTRQAAAKSMTKDNQKAFEEDTQAAKERKMASKKTKSKNKGADAVEAAGAKAKDAVSAAVERNPVSGPPSPAGDKENTGSGKSTQRTPKPSSKSGGKRRALPAGYGDYRSSRGKDAESQRDTDREFDRLEAGDKDKEPARPSFGSVSEQREKNPPPKSEYPNFGSVKEQREKNPPPGNAGYSFGSVAEQRAKAGPVEPSKLRAGAEGTSGKSKGTRVGANDTTTEMPATTKDKDAERADRIKELATSGVSKDPGDDGKMPTDPAPRTKPTVTVTPTKDGKMPDPDKPGFMDRMRGRMKSFTSRPGAPAAPSSGSGGGSTPPPPPPSGGTKSTFAPPAAEDAASSYGDYTGGNDSSVGKRASTGGGDILGSGSKAGRDQYTGNTHTQKISAGYGPVTATTSGKATGSGKGGVTASTSGTASTHPRAQNANRGGRPTSKKK